MPILMCFSKKSADSWSYYSHSSDVTEWMSALPHHSSQTDVLIFPTLEAEDGESVHASPDVLMAFIL